MSYGYVEWRRVLKSCPDPAARGELILLANTCLELEQGGRDYLDIPIIPENESVDRDADDSTQNDAS
jgi:hypothetical protein